MAAQQAQFLPAGRRAYSDAELKTFVATLQLGDEVDIEWNSSAQRVPVLWKGTVILKGSTEVTVSWFQPPGIQPTVFPPAHACNILRMEKVAQSADPWASAQARSEAGQVGAQGPDPKDALTWGLWMNDTNKAKAAFEIKSWLRGRHGVPDDSLTQSADRSTHEKNVLLLTISSWVDAFIGDPRWAEVKNLDIIAFPIFRLEQIRTCRNGEEFERFSRKYELTGVKSTNRLNKTLAGWNSKNLDAEKA